MTRQQVAQMRDEVQASVNGEGTAGCATSKGSAIMGALQGKRYGSVATGEEDAQTDIEMDGKPQHLSSDAGDEILGMDPIGMPASAQPRRHRCKKCCCACVCLLLLAGAAAFVVGGGLGVGVIPPVG